MLKHATGRVVLWGGRPGIDRQFGGEYDRVYARLQREYAQLDNRVRLMILPPVERCIAECTARIAL